jgi:hypothetical protein
VTADKPGLPGVQPEQDGQLQCLECGRWYRQLGQHVPAKHEMSADDYRAGSDDTVSDGLQRLVARARRTVAIWVLLVAGAIMIGDGIYGLAVVR